MTKKMALHTVQGVILVVQVPVLYLYNFYDSQRNRNQFTKYVNICNLPKN